MGDPRKTRKKYQTPMHPWSATRIEEEKIITHKFGTKNKKEIWRMVSALKRFKDQAKKLSSLSGAQADLERASALAPDNSDVYVAKARLARSQGRLVESIAFCDQAIALDPLDQDARSDRARALYYLGRLDEAFLRQALRIVADQGLTTL